MSTITFAAHVAYLDPMTGEGIMVLPHSADDLALGGMVSLHTADWGHAITHLECWLGPHAKPSRLQRG